MHLRGIVSCPYLIIFQDTVSAVQYIVKFTWRFFAPAEYLTKYGKSYGSPSKLCAPLTWFRRRPAFPVLNHAFSLTPNVLSDFETWGMASPSRSEKFTEKKKQEMV